MRYYRGSDIFSVEELVGRGTAANESCSEQCEISTQRIRAAAVARAHLEYEPGKPHTLILKLYINNQLSIPGWKCYKNCQKKDQSRTMHTGVVQVLRNPHSLSSAHSNQLRRVQVSSSVRSSRCLHHKPQPPPDAAAARFVDSVLFITTFSNGLMYRYTYLKKSIIAFTCTSCAIYLHVHYNL